MTPAPVPERPTVARYPVEFMPDGNGTVMATIPGLPGVTFGADEAEAPANAADLLEAVLAGLMADGRALPEPKPAQGRVTIDWVAGGD